LLTDPLRYSTINAALAKHAPKYTAEAVDIDDPSKTATLVVTIDRLAQRNPDPIDQAMASLGFAFDDAERIDRDRETWTYKVDDSRA
jgi:hypothetical protein